MSNTHDRESYLEGLLAARDAVDSVEIPEDKPLPKDYLGTWLVALEEALKSIDALIDE